MSYLFALAGVGAMVGAAVNVAAGAPAGIVWILGALAVGAFAVAMAIPERLR